MRRNRSSSPAKTAPTNKRAKLEEKVALTADEAALYDRQIRMWGMEGQRRLRNSRVLLIGMGALNSEVCKNLVLGGVGKVTLMDDAIVATEDLRSQIFVRQAGIGKQRSEACIELVKDLNPLVQVEIAAGNIMHLPTSFYEQFDIISMTGVDLATILHVDEVCRQCVGIKLYCTDIHGMCGWVFNDLGQSHEFTVEREVTDEKDTTKKIKEASIVTEAWPSMPDALSNTSAWVGKKQKQVQRNVSPVYFLFRLIMQFQQEHGKMPSRIGQLTKLRKSFLNEELQMPDYCLNDSFLKSFLPTIGHDLVPVAAIVGGALSQDIIKAISGQGNPIRNFFAWNGYDFTGKVACFGL